MQIDFGYEERATLFVADYTVFWFGSSTTVMFLGRCGLDLVPSGAVSLSFFIMVMNVEAFLLARGRI